MYLKMLSMKVKKLQKRGSILCGKMRINYLSIFIWLIKKKLVFIKDDTKSIKKNSKVRETKALKLDVKSKLEDEITEHTHN